MATQNDFRDVLKTVDRMVGVVRDTLQITKEDDEKTPDIDSPSRTSLHEGEDKVFRQLREMERVLVNTAGLTDEVRYKNVNRWSQSTRHMLIIPTDA